MALWIVLFLLVIFAVVCLTSDPQRRINRRMSRRVRKSRNAVLALPH